MREMTVRMAGLTFCVAFRSAQIGRMLAPYRARGSRAFRIEATEEDARTIAARGGDASPAPAEAESLALLEALCVHLPKWDCLMMHAACLAVDGSAYAFLAPSGTGKTTHMLNWMRLMGARAAVVNGDKPFVRRTEAGFRAYASPWAGKERLHAPGSAPLAALCVLERGFHEEITALTPREALPRVIRQIYLPREDALAEKTLDLAGQIARSVPAFLLRCTASPEAARLAIQAMLPAPGAARTTRLAPFPDAR